MDILLQQQHQLQYLSQSSYTDGQPELWEAIYTLWNWMGIIGKVPFDFKVVMNISQMSRLLDLAIDTLSNTGPVREMAASCLACWLTRPDLENSKFQLSFVDWSKSILDEFVTSTKNNNQNDMFTVMGVLQTLVTILKVSTAPRDVILTSMEQYSPLILHISRGNNKSSNLLLRKYVTKWWTRLGILYLPPKIASWRYQRGRRSLRENLQKQQHSQKDNSDADENLTVDKGENHIESDDYFFLIPDQVEAAMGQVMSSLKDVSTVVRWSAAKGVGRITCRLPAICAEDVLDAILHLFDDVEQDNDWHGACLALAELARRGLILPHRLKDVIPKIVEAIHYDVPRRQTSVGVHVRDAACYSYWALARAYSPNMLKPFIPQLGESVVVAFLFDREVNCRRAANAAFQEMVGRQGAQNFKNGIPILTTADYFSLGNRKDSYTRIAMYVAQFDEYRRPIIDHLYLVKLSHWDPSIRLLASKALNGLTSTDLQYMSVIVLPYLLKSCFDEKNLPSRHGSTLGLAEIVLAFGEVESMEKYLSPELLDSITEAVPTIEKRRLYRGKGGEQMRAAVCRLIECISITRISLTVPQQVRFLDSIDACIPHPNESIQDLAGKALYALMRSYFPVGSKGPSARLQSRVVDKYTMTVRTSVNPAATRGFSLALGYLPPKLLAPSSSVLDMSLSCLCRSSRPDAKVGDDKDVETRRNSLISLARICESVGLDLSCAEKESVVEMSEGQMNHVFTAFFRAMDDYNTDQRGDVGSKCRLAAMDGLLRLATMSSRHSQIETTYFSRDRCLLIVGLFLKQFAEKLNSVRAEASVNLLAILDDKSPIKPFVAEREALLEAFSTPDSEVTNWSDASITFPIVMKAANVDCYFAYIISGLIISVGCLTQSITQNASTVLIQWCKDADETTLARLGAGK